MIKAIIYDLGDIFYDAKKWRKWIHLYLKQNNYTPLSYHDLFDIWEKKYLINVYLNPQSSYKSLFTSFLKEVGFSPNSTFLTTCFEKKKAYEATITPFPNVQDTLKKIQEIGTLNLILSDNELGATAIQNTILNKLGIDSIDFIYTSVDIGYSKPNPRAYHHVLNAHDLNPQATLFVGHEKEELDGAKACKIGTVAYNYDENATADYKLQNFSELLTILTEKTPS